MLPISGSRIRRLTNRGSLKRLFPNAVSLRPDTCFLASPDCRQHRNDIRLSLLHYYLHTTTHHTPRIISYTTMGNICSRSANKPDHPFSHPGQSLASSAPSEHHRHNKAPAPRAPLPAKHRQSFGTAGRTLGGGDEEPGTGTDARTRAALAAQVCCCVYLWCFMMVVG